METIPSEETCLQLLQNTGCSQKVIDHCLAVRALAVRIAEKAHADVALVEAGALLHDIGRATTHGPLHGVKGAEIAVQLGLSQALVLIIERHLGAGIPKDEARRIGLPPKDYLPETLEEKIVAHADNLIDGKKRQPIEAEIEYALKKGLPQLAERLRTLHNELSRICGIDLNEI